MSELACLASMGNLISNLGDMILWYATGFPVGEWMKEALMKDFHIIMTECTFTEVDM